MSHRSKSLYHLSSLSLVIVDINPEFLTRVLPLALHEVVIRRWIVRVGGWHRGHHPPSASAAPVEGRVAHGVGAGRRLGGAASLQTVLTIACARVLLLRAPITRVLLVARLSASRGCVMTSVTSGVTPASHLGVLSLEGVVAVIMVRGRGVVMTRGRTHRSTVVLPLALTEQLLLKEQLLFYHDILTNIFCVETI